MFHAFSTKQNKKKDRKRDNNWLIAVQIFVLVRKLLIFLLGCIEEAMGIISNVVLFLQFKHS